MNDEKQLAINAARRRMAIQQAKIRLNDQGRKISEDAHPEFKISLDNTKGMLTRFNMKNFGNPDKESYLQSFKDRHPELEFKRINGSVYALNKETDSWQPIDPPGFDMQDISDILYDIPAGVAEGTASVVGGVGGGLLGSAIMPGVGTTIGALGGAAAAGGGMARGLEEFRQGIGRFTGASQERDTSAINTATAFGVASPLLLGSGAGGKQLAKYGGKLFTNNLRKEAIENAQKSIFSRAKSSLSKVGSATSGVPEGSVKYAAKNMGEIVKAQKLAVAEGNDLAGANVVRSLREQIQGAVDTKGEQVGKEFGIALEAVSKDGKNKIATKKLFEPLNDLYKKYEDAYLDDLTRLELKHGREKAAVEIQKRMSFDNFNDVKAAYKKMVPLTDLASPKEIHLMQENVNAFSKLAAGFDATKSKTGAARDIENVSSGLAKSLGNALNNLPDVGADFSKVKNKWGDHQKTIKSVKTHFGDYAKNPEKAEEITEGALSRIVGSGQQTKKQNIKDISTKLGIDIEDTANKQVALKYYTDPSVMPVSGGGTTSTSRSNLSGDAGGALGFLSGGALTGGFGGSMLGRAAGKVVGAAGAGPWAQLKMMKLNSAAGVVPDFLQRVGPEQIATPINTGAQIWSNLYNNKE